MDFLPNYIKKYAIITTEKQDKTQCFIKCSCGHDVFDIFYLHFKWDKKAQQKYDVLQKEFDIELQKREVRCNQFRKQTEKKHGKLILSGGFYKGKQYVVLSKQRMTAQEVGTGDFLKPNGCVAYLDTTAEYRILSDNLAKRSTGYIYLTAKCRKCEKEILLFDSRIHGYDGLIETLEGKSRNNDMTGIMKLKKPHCKDFGYIIYMTFSSTGKEDLITETDGLITEENWKDGFDWLTIDLKCDKCGKVSKSWQSIETM